MDDRCGARAAECVCTLSAGHPDTEPHHCTSDGCGGEWFGEHGTDAFRVARFPKEDEMDPMQLRIARILEGL